MEMSPNKPYLVRAFYDWITDNNCTPYVLVSALFEGVEVPVQHVMDGQIVLNVAPRAVTGFHLDNVGLSFNARFGGIPTNIYVPIEAILGIYARENNEGMIFQVAENKAETRSTESDAADFLDPDPPPSPSGPKLRIVK